MRKRIFAFVMAVVVAVGCVGYRPQRTYAGEMLAVGASEVLYALFLSMGVIVSANASHQEKMEATQEIYDALPPKGKAAVLGILGASEVADGVYSWASGLDRADLVTLWDAVFSVKASQVGFSVPVADFSPYPFVNDGSTNFKNSPITLGNFSSSPFAVAYGNEVAHVIALLPSGLAIRYMYRYSTGAVTDVIVKQISSDSVLTVGVDYWKRYSGNKTYDGTSTDISVSGEPSLSVYSFHASTWEIPFPPYGVSWGSSDDRYFIGSPFAGALSFYDGVSIYDEGLLDCDTWADSLGRVGEVDKEVGVITGKDLSGYNTSESAYDGLITGVNNPALNPEIPVTPDLTGIAGVLANILSWLKSLPRTIVGQGALDFSKFNNIALSGVFPFCIPFDLINVFKSFNGVQPIEPKWVIDLSATPLKAGGQIVLDLTQFGVWVSIIRYFCYASFVVGLILITRKVIKG